MRQILRIALLSLVTLGATMTMTSCDALLKAIVSQGLTQSQESYYGTWKCIYNGTSYEQVTISADQISWVKHVPGYTDEHWTITGLTWSITNTLGDYKEQYPYGYQLTGRLSVLGSNNGYGAFPPRADGSSVQCRVGDEVVVWWYLAKDKNSVSCGYYNNHEPNGGNPFIKQP
jgi:hypothetical protein